MNQPNPQSIGVLKFWKRQLLEYLQAADRRTKNNERHLDLQTIQDAETMTALIDNSINRFQQAENVSLPTCRAKE